MEGGGGHGKRGGSIDADEIVEARGTKSHHHTPTRKGSADTLVKPSPPQPLQQHREQSGGGLLTPPRLAEEGQVSGRSRAETQESLHGPTLVPEAILVHRASSTNSLLTLAKKKKPLPPPSRRTLELNKAVHGRKKHEVLVFIFPLLFALVPVVVLMASPDVSNRLQFNVIEHVPPAVCFTIMPIAQIYLFAFRSRGKASLPFFGNVRTHWCVEMHNTGDISAINTLRDFLKVTSWLTANAVLAASILVTFTYQVFSSCNNQTFSGCTPKNLYLIAQLVVLIVNLFFVAMHMLQATRFALSVEFMLNTRELGGRLLRSEAVASVLSRANLYYGIGLRQTYYAIPLFSWLLGPWPLVAVTVLYLGFLAYVESVDTLLHHVNHEIGEIREAHARSSSMSGAALGASTTTNNGTGGGGGGAGAGGAGAGGEMHYRGERGAHSPVSASSVSASGPAAVDKSSGPGLSLEALGLARIDPPPPPPREYERVLTTGGDGGRDRGMSLASTLSSNN